MRAIGCLIAFILLFFIFTANTFAVSLSISGVSSTIDQSQDFQLNVNLTCSGCSDSYLRGVFYPSGTSYFGFTQDNSGNWINAPGSSCTNYFKIAQSDLVTGSWSGTLKIKPDKDSVYYNGPGEYSFKVGRYTQSCSSSSVAWSDEKIIAITGPTPTPTQGPTSTPTNTQTPTPSVTNAPTLTPTPTSIKVSLTPTKKISPSPTPKKPNFQSSSAGVLGNQTKESKTNELNSAKTQVLSANDNSLFPKILIATGIVFIMLCVIVICYPYIKRLVNKSADE